MTYTIEKQLKTKCNVLREFETEEQVIEYLKKNKITVTGKPYVFTCINLSDRTMIKYRYRGMLCSPEKIMEMITNEH